MKGIVYHSFNTVNGKAYVGQTWDTIENRWSQHCRKDGGMLFQRAIQKYGPDNFELTILFSSDSQDELDFAEDAFINELETMHPKGYNLRHGGSHGRHSAESKKKMSESHKGKHSSIKTEFKKGMIPWNKGIAFSDEVKEKMRAAKLGMAIS